MRRIFKSVSLVVTFALAGALSVSPANATTQTPILNAPTPGTAAVNNLNINYVLPEAPLSGSVTVTLTRTSPALPAHRKDIFMSDDLNVNLTVDVFASDSSIVNQGAGKINSVNSPTGVLPAGVYEVRLSYQDMFFNPTASASVQNITLTLPCTAGTYSTDGNVPIGSDCTQSPANSYVATAGATAASACPSGLISPAGSDAVSDCVAPPVATPLTKALPTLAKGKKMRIRALATEIEMALPAKSKATAKVAKSSRKNCRVSGTSIRALKTGNCVVTVKVKPKKGKATTKTTTITIR